LVDTQIDSPQSRLARALSVSGLFAGSEPIPGSQIPAISMPMHLGLDALSCIVTAAGSDKVVFAKAYRDGALDPFDFEGAAEASMRAGEAGLGPRLLEWDVDAKVMLFEPAGPEWRMALARDSQKPDVKAAIIAAKKAWHRQEPLSRDLSPFELARAYCRRLEPHLVADAADPIPFKGLVPFPSMKQWFVRIEEAFTAAGTDMTPIHGENTVSNVLIGPDNRMLLVDFDRAVNADPLFDLGALCLDLCRNDDERMEAVEIYAGRADHAMLARAKLYGLIDDFLWGCWALLAELNPAMAGPELFKYASNRFVRMSHHLQAFDVASLLQKI